MNVGFDISQTGQGKAGCGYFAAAMIDALLRCDDDRRYTLFTDFGDFYFDPGLRCDMTLVGPRARPGPHHATRKAAHDFWCSPGLDARIAGLDIVHANNFWCPDNLSTTRLVYTLYDLGFLVDPEWTTEANRTGCLEGVFRAAQYADAIAAISTASRNHFLAMFPHYPHDRVHVVYPASRYESGVSLDVTPPHALGGLAAAPFFLCVGTIEPRKNQRALVAAYAAYRERAAAVHPLVFAGGEGWMMDGFAEEVAALGLAAHVRFTGYVSDDELAWLYAHCLANVYVSRFEGFGLPVLEGMVFGAPTICSDNTSLPEVGGHAAWYVNANDREAITAALLGVAGDAGRRAQMAAASRAQAQRFGWRASAEALGGVYEDVAKRPPMART
ncbi:MAG: glycosyltransferase family 4 protein [Proteobacteria bacterium]|nr:glycosyltransferase family 4 protein [Pseudomonadota bacterium]